MGRKIPKTTFVFKHAGKKLTIVAQTHKKGNAELWGGQSMCPWGCPAVITITGKITPERVFDHIKVALKTHYRISHTR